MITLIAHTGAFWLGQSAPSAGGLETFLGPGSMVLMFAVIYLLIIRPASKQRREHEQLLNALKKDDEVVTQGGMYGKVIEIEDKVVVLGIADKVKVRIMRDRIAGRWNPDVPSKK